MGMAMSSCKKLFVLVYMLFFKTKYSLKLSSWRQMFNIHINIIAKIVCICSAMKSVGLIWFSSVRLQLWHGSGKWFEINVPCDKTFWLIEWNQKMIPPLTGLCLSLLQLSQKFKAFCGKKDKASSAQPFCWIQSSWENFTFHCKLETG